MDPRALDGTKSAFEVRANNGWPSQVGKTLMRPQKLG